MLKIATNRSVHVYICLHKCVQEVLICRKFYCNSLYRGFPRTVIFYLSSETLHYGTEEVNPESENREKSGTLAANTALNNPSGNSHQLPAINMEDLTCLKSETSEGVIHLSSKYEQLVRSQMSEKLESEAGADQRFDTDIPDVNGRGTPVGEDSVKQYQDSESLKLSSKYYSQDEDDDTFKNSLLDDYLGKGSGGNIAGGDTLENQESALAVDDLGTGRPQVSAYGSESPVQSRHSSHHSSARQTPVSTENQDRSPSVASVQSRSSSSRQVLDDLINDALGRDTSKRISVEDSQEVTRARQESVSSNEPHSIANDVYKTTAEEKRPPVNGSISPEQIADVLSPADRHSPIRQEFLSGSPYIQTSASQNAVSSQRSPQRELISPAFRNSQEKLYSPVNARLASDLGSNASQQGSRPQSITSEQELTQYYDNMPDTQGANAIVGQSGQRTASTCSLPAVGSSKRISLDRRSYTPDNHIRVPASGPIPKGAFLPSRTPPQSPYSNTSNVSNASSRTVTPVNTLTEPDIKLTQVRIIRNVPFVSFIYLPVIKLFYTCVKQSVCEQHKYIICS